MRSIRAAALEHTEHLADTSPRHTELGRHLLLAELGARRDVLPANSIAQHLHDIGDRWRAAAWLGRALSRPGLERHDSA
jgi:hypothetical protein